MQNMGGGKTALGLDTGIGVLICYFGNLACGLPLGIIYSILVVVQDKTNRIARFHAFQSLFLAALGVVYGIIIGIGVFITMMIDVAVAMAIGIPFIFTGLLSLIATVIGLGLLYFVIMAAIKGFNGEIYKIPIIGNLAEKYSAA
jgi:uncharacterized membrane protein